MKDKVRFLGLDVHAETIAISGPAALCLGLRHVFHGVFNPWRISELNPVTYAEVPCRGEHNSQKLRLLFL
jgi:hypothetical protein